jgi:RHS repeat-associated protein
MATLGLYFFNARWVDSSLGRFIQPDTIVPDHFNPQDWDRYAFVRNNPVNYIDPDGHFPWPIIFAIDGESLGEL